MPRRAIAAIAATIAGLGLLFSFKTPHHTTTRPGAVAAGPKSGSGGATGSSGSAGSAGSTGSASGGRYRNGTVAGPTEDTQWGPVQVQVTVAGGRITTVTELQAPDDRPHSIEINQQAAPLLQQEVLTAQSAQIDGVSGATITSGGYIQSLQAALDEMRS